MKRVDMKRADILASALLLALSAFVYLEAEPYAHQGAQLEYFGAAFFPQLLALALAFCAVLQIVYAVLGQSLRRIDFIDRKGFVRMIVAFAVAVVYWLTIDRVGFYISTPIFIFLLTALMGARNLPAQLAAAFGAPVVVWLLFEKFLVIDMPPGVILPAIFGE